MPWHVVELDGPVGTSPVTAAVRGAATPPRRVLLVRDDHGRLHATQATCPHMGQPLGDARVEDGVVECRHHAYRFRLGDGVCVGPGDDSGDRVDPLAVLPVREEAGRVLVDLRDDT
jgi:nitrite reductase (NADH) small subunit